MADRIKGITVEIGGDTTGLKKALSGVNSEISSTQSQLKDVERLLKLDPTNTELLQQKQRLLSQAVDETKTKLTALKDAESQAQQQFAEGKISQAQYEGLQREIIATEQSLKKLEDQAGSSNATLSKISATADQVAAGANKVADATKTLSTATAAGAAGLAALAVKAGKSADDLNTLAKQSGFSTSEIQKWQYASDLVDVNVDDIVKSAQKMKKNMVSTSADTTAAWKRIGVSVTDANGNLRDSTEVFYDALQGLSQIQNGTERDTVAMQLFGKSADQLAGIVDDGGASLKDLGQQAQDAGLILSQDALDGANAFNDGLDTLKAKSTAAFLSAGTSLSETLLPMLDELLDKMSGVLEWVAGLDGEQLKMIGTILLVVAAISPVAKLIGGISTTISGLSSAMGFLAANPIVLVIGAVAALVAGLVILWNTNENFRAAVITGWTAIQEKFLSFDTWLDTVFSTDWTTRFGAFGNVLNSFFASAKTVVDGIKTALSGVITFVKGVFSGDWSMAWQGIQTVFRGIFEAMEGIAKAPLNGIIGLLNVMIDGINFFISGINKALSLLAAFGVSAPQIPELGKLAYLAKGGILSSGSAIVGERGPELLSMIGGSAQVMPLADSSRRSVEAGKAEYNQEINIYSHDALTPAEIARENRLAMRKMVAGVRR